LLQRLSESGHPLLSLRVVSGKRHEHTHPPHALTLLRAYREWPSGGRSSNSFDEVASSHCLHQGRDYAE
jgi:hypothetical protein